MPGLVIHAINARKGTLAIAALPGAGGDYAGDLRDIGAWRPGLVISLTTQDEMDAVGATDLGQDLQRMGSRWVHLPIDDFGVPGTEVVPLWPAASASARQALGGGGRVLVHCRGGCGRAGMIALRLLIESGERPEPALKRLRAVRSCAVETDAQMQWAIA